MHVLFIIELFGRYAFKKGISTHTFIQLNTMIVITQPILWHEIDNSIIYQKFKLVFILIVDIKVESESLLRPWLWMFFSHQTGPSSLLTASAAQNWKYIKTLRAQIWGRAQWDHGQASGNSALHLAAQRGLDFRNHLNSKWFFHCLVTEDKQLLIQRRGTGDFFSSPDSWPLVRVL